MIPSRENNPFIEELKSVSEFYPNNFVYESSNNSLHGEIGFNRPYKGIYIEDQYQIELIFKQNHPDIPPVVKENGGKIPLNVNNHAYPDDTICLGPPIELLAKFKCNPTLFGFIDSILVPNLYWHSYLKKYGTEPWKAYRHGDEGIREYRDSVNLRKRYFSIFETDNINVVLRLLEMVVKENYLNNPTCPCGRGKQLNDCHYRLIENLLQMPYLKISHLARDYWHLSDNYKRRAK